MSVADVRTVLILGCSVFLSLTAIRGDYCGKPGTPYNGHVSPLKSQYNFSETVTYSCDDTAAYSLVGQSKRRCLNNKTWESDIPKCEINLALGKKVERGSGMMVDNKRDTFFNLARGNSIIVDLGREFDISYVTLALKPHTAYSLQIDVIGGRTSTKRQCIAIRNRYSDYEDNKFVCNNGNSLRGQQVAITDQSPSANPSYPIYEIGVYSGTGESKCGDPDVPSHGSVDRSVIDEAVYACDDNYVLQGAHSSKCVDGRWNPTGQYCVHQPGVWVGCGEPGTPNNGDRFIGGKLQNESTYFCNKGAILIGSSLRTCMPNGTWSPQQIPRCVSNLAYNKIVKHQNFDVAKRADSVDGIATTCESQAGQFYGYIDLGEPIVFDNGIILVKSTNTISISVFVTNDTGVTWPRFNNKNTLTNFCNINDVRPTNPLTCNHKEVARFVVIYLDKPASVCEVTVYNSKEETTCGQPDQPLHGRMKNRSSKSTTYECDAGYKTIGSSVTNCVNGTWNPRPPQCVQERTTTWRPTWRPDVTSARTMYTTSQPHTEGGNDSVAMGIMGIAVGATAACVAIILVSVLVYCFVRKHYKNRSRCDHDHSSRGSRSDGYMTTYRMPSERRCGDGDNVSIHLYDSIKEPDYLFATRRLPDGGGNRFQDTVSNDLYDSATLASNNSNDQRHRLLPQRPPLYDSVPKELETAPNENRNIMPLPSPDDPLLDVGDKPRTSL